MDGALIGTIVSSSLVIGGAVAGGLWRLGRSIGRLEGKVNGLDPENIGKLVGKVDQMDARLTRLGRRIGRMDKRINGVFSSLTKRGDS